MSTAGSSSASSGISDDDAWPRVAVVGAGAVGSYFGAMLARAGAPVTLVGRGVHMDAVARDGLYLDGLTVNERIRVHAATEMSAAHDADIILVCVKTVDTETVASGLKPHLAAASAVLSLQNGVDNIDRMRSAARIEAIPAVVYVAAAMAGPGHVKHSGRGDLVIGRLPSAEAVSSADAVSLGRVFERAGIPCRIAEDIRTELWAKMVLNCAYNAISALGRSRYGAMLQSAPVRELMTRAIEETVRVARAEGVALAEADMLSAAWRLGESMPGALSSTGQDISRGKPTEIDSLNGYVVRLGAQHGIETPVNRALHTLVKLLEQSALGAG